MRRGQIDIMLTHSPPAGMGDSGDPAHAGFTAFHGLVTRLAPRVLFHGHVRHYYGPQVEDKALGRTLVVNAIPYRLVEI